MFITVDTVGDSLSYPHTEYYEANTNCEWLITVDTDQVFYHYINTNINKIYTKFILRGWPQKAARNAVSLYLGYSVSCCL